MSSTAILAPERVMSSESPRDSIQTVPSPRPQFSVVLVEWKWERMNASFLPVVLERGDDGVTARIPNLVGCISEGENEEEAFANVKCAFDELCASYADAGRSVPLTPVDIQELLALYQADETATVRLLRKPDA